MSKEEKEFINSGFSVLENRNSKIISGNFTITARAIPFQTSFIGSPPNNLDISIFAGKVSVPNQYNIYDDGYVANAKVTAIKNGIVYDYDITRDGDNVGTYFLYLENGIYDIRIEAQSYNRTIKNIEIKNGIREYKEDYLSGIIKKRVVDTIEFNGSANKRLVYGQIIDQNGKPADDIEIVIVLCRDLISLSRELKAFVKTDKDGKFSFILNGAGPYDIVVRSHKHHAKVIKGYKFDLNKGFFMDVVLDNLFFNSDGEWIKINV